MKKLHALIIFFILLTLIFSPSGISVSHASTDQNGVISPMAAPTLCDTNVAEAGGYDLVYQLAIPNDAVYGSGVFPTYSIDNAVSIPDGSFDRIAYCLELDSEYVWVSMDAFTASAAETGVPVQATGAIFQQTVTNMNVASNKAGMTTGNNIATGSIEFWNNCYATDTVLGLPGANGGTYDFDDNPGGQPASCYGSMQVHNYGAAQTVFAWNRWAGAGTDDLGIGNNPGPQAPDIHPDWTFMSNAGSYTTKNLSVYVASTPSFSLDSFTRYNPATSPTDADTLIFRATFDEGVQNVDVTDFAVNSVSTATVTNVSPVYAPGAWTFCANENATCSFTGTKLVRYGASSSYNYGIYTDGVACDNATFGDPIYGTVKTCDYADLPSVYEITVSGGDLITFNGDVGLDLASGQNIQNISGTALPTTEPATDEVYTLNNTAAPSTISFSRHNPATSPTSADTLVFRALFSDHVQNVDTTDFVVNSTSTAGVTAVTQVGAFCANENETCNFTGTRFVRYGSGGTYSAITGPFTDGVACTNAVFGDPTPGVVKTCELLGIGLYDITVSGGDLSGFNGTVGINLAGAGTLNIQNLYGTALPGTEPTIDELYNLYNNIAPSFTKGADETVLEDAGPQTVIGWATNIDDGNGGTQTLTFNVTNNTNTALFSTGPALNATNGNLTYTPVTNANGSATITITLSDDGGTANGGDDTSPSQTFVINITPVNDAPAGTDKTITITEGGSHTFVASDFGFTDPNDSPANSFNRVEITTLPAAGTLELNSVAVTAGTFIDVIDIPNLIFTPATNGNGTPYASFTFRVEDDGGVLNSGVNLDQSANTITFNVTAVNDDPSDISLSANTIAENEAINTVIGTLSTTDVDPTDTFTYSLRDNLAGCGNNANNARFNISGDELRTSEVFDYETPPISFDFCVETKDSAGSTYAKEFTIAVTNVNEAPVNSVPVAQSTNDNTPLTFSTADSNLISISDVDAGAADVEMTLSVNDGTLTLASVADLIFSVGNGVDDATMTFQGTIAEINTALDGLVYTPNSGFSSTDTLTVLTDDLGESGSGGALTDTDTVDINVADFAPTVNILSAYKSVAGASSVLSDGDTLYTKPKDLLLKFSEVMDNTTAGDQVTNPLNYYLIGEGDLAGIQTTKATDICAAIETSGVNPNDKLISLSVSAQGSPVTEVKIHVADFGLPRGEYLFVACGSATLRDLNGNALAGDGTNSGTDFTLAFTVIIPRELPQTGFAPNQVNRTFAQPAESSYANTGMSLYIPSLSERLTITGVPENGDGWNLSWLGDQAGWLAGSAYPTWSGNTLLTAHVWNANNQPGPFYNLKKLRYGEAVYIYAHGAQYTYEVRENMLVDPSDVSLFYRHETQDWITLVTCESYDEDTGQYTSRRIVRAVLVDIH